MAEITQPSAVPSFRSETASVNGVRLHYWIGGDPQGTPVLLWHGFLGTGHSWRKVMPLLAGAGYAVLVPDMRGYGDSDKPEGTAGYDGLALAEEFRALVRQIGFGGGQPLILAAHDMGAPPALLWAAGHPEEISGLLYAEGPAMLSSVLTKIISYTPEAMKEGSMWWWILPLAPDVPERLIVGHERAFLTWFYDKATAHRDAIEPAAVDETLRTFSGTAGVLGAHGVYRAAFTTIAQTEPLTNDKVSVPVVALGGVKGLGAMVPVMLKMVAKDVTGVVVADCGHFVPEERPEEVVKQIQTLSSKATGAKTPAVDKRRLAWQAGITVGAALAAAAWWTARKPGSAGQDSSDQNNFSQDNPTPDNQVHSPEKGDITTADASEQADLKQDASTQDNQTHLSEKGNNTMADTTSPASYTNPPVSAAAIPASQVYPPLPPDNPERTLTLAQSDVDQNLPHLGVVGDTYTILLTGEDTAGKYCLIDMLVPPGGGPPPHRHDFEESFILLEGEIVATFRGKKMTVRVGDTVNIPANAPHQFTNASSAPARLLCTCVPAGQELFFMETGVKVETRTTAPPKLDAAGMAQMMAKAKALAPKFKTELLEHA